MLVPGSASQAPVGPSDGTSAAGGCRSSWRGPHLSASNALRPRSCIDRGKQVPLCIRFALYSKSQGKVGWLFLRRPQRALRCPRGRSPRGPAFLFRSVPNPLRQRLVAASTAFGT